MSISLVIKDYFNIFKNKTLVLHPGLTFITGCNGSGKSTLCNEIARNLKNKHIDCAYLDCNKTFHTSDVQSIHKAFKLATFLQKGFSSEHEHYENLFSEWIATIRPGNGYKGHKYVVVIDGLDSGGDVIFYKKHISLFELMVKDAQERGIEMYVIVTCNNFYYLSAPVSGEAIISPTFSRKKLPLYTVRQFSKYEQDIRKSAVARGFLTE